MKTTQRSVPKNISAFASALGKRKKDVEEKVSLLKNESSRRNLIIARRKRWPKNKLK